MKKILIITLLISAYCNGQCTEMIVSNDDVAEKTTIRSDKMQINDLSVTIQAYPSDKNLYVLDFKVSDRCVDYGDEIIIVFKNGQKLKYRNNCYNFNCRGQSGNTFRSKAKNLLNSEEISTIRVYTNGNYCQVELTEEQSKKLLLIMQCAYGRDWQNKTKYKLSE